MTYDKEESNSGVLVMMYAKRVVDGNTLSFQQVCLEPYCKTIYICERFIFGTFAIKRVKIREKCAKLAK